MSNYFLNDSRFVNQGLEETSTTLNAKIGDVVRVNHPTYGIIDVVYLYGVASLAANDAVTYNASTGATTRLVAGGTGPVAISLAANTSTSAASWFAIRGKLLCNTAGTVAAGARVYATATAGSVDDAVNAGDELFGAFFATAVTGAGTCVVHLQDPYIF
jgi:hypothetical protein